MEQFLPIIYQAVSTLILIGTVILGVGATLGAIRSQGEHLEKLDAKVDKLEVAFVQLARQDERIAAMDQRLLAQGRRLDRMQYGRQTQEIPQD